MQPVIGFLGLGIMGSGMVANLLAASYPVVVWNRSPEKAEAVRARGATVAESPRAVAEQVDVLMLCVTNEIIVNELLFDPVSGALSADSTVSTIIDLSTIRPEAAESFGIQLRKRNIMYIDAPVSGGDVGARNGTLTVMAGGDEAAFNKISPLLKAIASTIVYTGPTGNGQKTKCINQIVVALTIIAMTEGLHLAETSGLNLETTLTAIRGGAAGSWALENYAPRILRQEFGPGFYARDMLKDLNYVKDLSASSDTFLPGLELAISLYHSLLSTQAGSTLGNHALIEHYRQQLADKRSSDFT